MKGAIKDWKTTTIGVVGIILTVLQMPGIQDAIALSAAAAHVAGVVGAVATSITLIFKAVWK